MVVHWFDICMIMSSNLGRTKVNFLFAKLSLAWMWKGRGNPSWMGSQGGAGKPSHNCAWMEITTINEIIFVLTINHPQYLIKKSIKGEKEGLRLPLERTLWGAKFQRENCDSDVKRKAVLGRNQREDIGAQGKTQNSNSKQRKFQVRGAITR